MNTLTALLTKAFDIILKPFDALSPVYGLCFISVLSGFVLIKLFVMSSNKTAVDRAKNRIIGHLLEVAIYQHDIVISLRALGKMLAANLSYIKTTFIPLCVVLIPCVLIMAQLNLRYAYRPFDTGEQTILTVKLEDNADLYRYSLSVSDGLVVDTPALRIEDNNEINWRIKAVMDGVQTISISDNNGQVVTKKVFVNQNELKLAPGRYKNWWDNILYPGEKVLNNQSEIKSIEIKYPQTRYTFFSMRLHWLVVFFCVSLVAGLFFKMIFKW